MMYLPRSFEVSPFSVYKHNLMAYTKPDHEIGSTRLGVSEPVKLLVGVFVIMNILSLFLLCQKIFGEIQTSSL